MTSKKYVILIVSLLYVFMILNLALWHGLVKEIFDGDDLNRMGSFKLNREVTPDKEYNNCHISLSEYINSPDRRESFDAVDVITIGDSFSNGGRLNGGVRLYYQDYIGGKYKINILNTSFVENSLIDLSILIQSGMLDKIHPKAVILQTVERQVQWHMGSYEINPVTKREAEQRILSERGPKKALSLSSGFFPPVAIKANMKFIYNQLYHKIYPERLSPEVYITELDRNFFTNKDQENILLFYKDDLHYMNSPVNASIVNQNLNNAAKILREKGIILFFMPCPDKYDLYYPYIINHNGRPENNFFTEIRRVSPKEYIFIDTMKILREALERGEKDIYWSGDTHWSWKGAELVCDELVKYFDWLK